MPQENATTKTYYFSAEEIVSAWLSLRSGEFTRLPYALHEDVKQLLRAPDVATHLAAQFGRELALLGDPVTEHGIQATLDALEERNIHRQENPNSSSLGPIAVELPPIPEKHRKAAQINEVTSIYIYIPPYRAGQRGGHNGLEVNVNIRSRG